MGGDGLGDRCAAAGFTLSTSIVAIELNGDAARNVGPLPRLQEALERRDGLISFR